MTTRSRPVPFGEWLPDLPPLENPGALIAKNCIPEIRSYRDLRSLSEFSDALSSQALGAFWLQISDNTVFNFAGDATNLYTLTNNNSTWSNISRVSPAYSGVTNWEFSKFGDRVIAVDSNNTPQSYVAGTSQTNFEDLAGSPPNAKRIAVVRDFVVLGDLSAVGRGPNFIQWSAFNNAESWAPSRATQADFQELFGRGGRVQKIVPGEYGVVFQEHSIYRMNYIGPPVTFQLDEVERGRGTPAPDSVIWTGNLVFYYGHDGFYRFNGQYSEPIGANRVNRWFSDRADLSSLDTMRGAVDRRNRLAMWSFRSSADLDVNDVLIIFNWAANKWSYAELDVQLLSEFVSSGFTLDDPAFDALYSSDIDGTNQTPFDSEAYFGGVLSLQAFTSANRSATFDGDPLAAEIDTKELIGANNGRMFVNSVRPLINGGPDTGITVSIGTRNLAQNNVSFTLPRSLNSIGEANIRKDSRYQRYRCTISGGFTHANGVMPVVRQRTGRR